MLLKPESDGTVPSTDELLQTMEKGHNHIFKMIRDDAGDFVVTLSEGKLAKEFGLMKEQLLGKKLTDCICAGINRHVLPYYERAFMGRVVDFETKISERTFSTTLSPIIKDGMVIEVVGSSIEITKRKQIEQQLQETEALYRSLVEDTLVGVYIAYVEHPGFVYVNPRLAEIFGYSQDELVEMTAADLVIPEERSIIRANQERRLQGDRSSIRYQFRGLRKNQSMVDVEVLQKTSVYKGKAAVIGILQDVTERKQAEEMIRKSEMLSIVGQMAAGVAHEIRNPLTSLKGFVQLLSRQSRDNKEYYRIMLAELNRIEFIISEFLVLAKPHVVIQREHEIKQLLEHIVMLAETNAIMYNVEIETHYEQGMPLIPCEENQLKQVFLNLLKNAIEAMPGGGKVTVTAKIEGQMLLVAFADQGCGIPEERLGKLGEPFFTTKDKGTGLGLMVSYKIIATHGGTIRVRSKEGEGTTFEVRIPVG
ncbi:PAS domain S-box protein [Brevibacillus reuszeri]|uniref:PAS domain S-box protein n=1 Tax=Brevibacillus reuszeri TaxID=54915 RepID=UPI002898C946|nr:PAS domain S-box protein [Brevibacillus reuszeri]